MASFGGSKSNQSQRYPKERCFIWCLHKAYCKNGGCDWDQLPQISVCAACLCVFISALADVIICLYVCISTGLSAEQSPGSLGCSCSASATWNHPFFHQADLSETRQGNKGTHLQHDLLEIKCKDAMINLPHQPTEHNPGLEEELWDCQTDHGISRVLPPTCSERCRK